MDELDTTVIERLEAVAGSERDPQRRSFAPVAELLRAAGRLAEARERVEAGIASDPDFASGHMVAARVYADLGLGDRARAALDQVLRLDRRNAEAGALRAALDTAEHASALDWARSQGESPAVDVGEGEVLTVTMGDLYLRQGAADRAVVVFESLSARDPGNASVRAKLAQAREALRSQQSEAASEQGAAAKSEAVAVSELAPQAVPIESLAPRIVDVGALAPDSHPATHDGETAPGADPPEPAPPGVDSFMAWLDGQ